ncbi:MAG: 4-hydroxy-tetrahydrodipicolinate synthase [Firmicutes bacterium]|nr:4-hydroxy-tetrahydrodipicolinate synthase [Bacillota bacterium]
MALEVKGIIPAMVTPSDESGNIIEDSLRKLTRYLIDGGVHGLFAIGGQGEFWAFTPPQKKRVLEIVLEEAKGRVPVYAGTGAVTTDEAVRLTRMASDAGADAVSVITPYFIKPNDDELFEHYAAIARSVKIPVLLYNNPARTNISLPAGLVERLSHIDNIVGIKDSSGDMTLTAEYIRRTGKDFAVLAGRDTLIYGTLVYGGRGSITATANVAPKLVVEIYEAYVAGDLKRSLEAQFRLAPLRLAFEFGTFPVVIKEALQMIGINAGEAVRPVGGLSGAKRDELRQVLAGLGILGA